MPIERYISFVLRYRWLVVVLALLVMLAASGGGRFLTVTSDYRTLFGEDNPHLAAFDALEATYSATNAALIAIAPRENSVFTRKTLSAIEELTEAVWQVPYSSRVNSLTNYSHSEAHGDDLVVEPLVDDALSLGDEDLARVREVALSASETAGRLVSHDGRVAGLVIHFVLPEDPEPAWVEITDHLAAVLEQARSDHGDLAYYLTGNVVMNHAFAEATKDDLETLVPLVFLVILVSAAVFLRSFFGTLLIAILIVFVIGTTIGFAGWLGTVFTPVSASIPIIVMTFSVAYSIHIILLTLTGMRNGLDRNEAIAESLRSNTWPVFLTTVTTAIGFLSLNSSEAPPFHVLGNFVAFGALCTFAYSITFVPAMLSILPLRSRPAAAGRSSLFDRLGEIVVARRRFLLWFVSLLVVALVTGIPRNELGDNWTRYFDERYEFRRSTDFVIENLTGLDRLEYSLEAGREGGITDPDYLRSVDAFAEWYREQPEVAHVQAFPDIMKRLNRNMHGDDPSFHRIPDEPTLAAQYLLLYEFLLPFGSDLNDRIDVAKSATRMTVVLRSSSSEEQRALDRRALAWLRANAPALAAEASGLTMVFAHLSQRNIDSMLRGTIVAMALISFILIGLFKDLRLGLISLVPNFIPAAMSFGLWGFLIGNVGLAASVVTAIAFGIIVDDTIHFLTKYQSARRRGLPCPKAVRYSFRTVGRALTTTTAVLSLGFLIFAFSGFESSWAMGLLITLTIVFALLADFLLLPPLLMAIDRRKS